MSKKIILKFILLFILIFFFNGSKSDAFTSSIDGVDYEIADNSLFSQYHHLIWVIDEPNVNCSKHEHHYIFCARIFNVSIENDINIIYEAKLNGTHEIYALNEKGEYIKTAYLQLYLENHSYYPYNSWSSFTSFDGDRFKMSYSTGQGTIYYLPENVITSISSPLKDKEGNTVFFPPQDMSFIQIVQGLSLTGVMEIVLGVLKALLPVLIGLISLYIGWLVLSKNLKKS